MGGAASCSSKGNAIAVAKVEDFDKDTNMKQCQISEKESVLVVKHKGQFYAMGANCTHYGAPLVKGSLCDGVVRCPWHGACFNVATGDIEQFPGFDSVPTYPTKVKGGQVYIINPDTITTSVTRPLSKKLRDSPTFVMIGSGPSAIMCAQTLRQEKFGGLENLMLSGKVLPEICPIIYGATLCALSKICSTCYLRLIYGT